MKTVKLRRLHFMIIFALTGSSICYYYLHYYEEPEYTIESQLEETLIYRIKDDPTVVQSVVHNKVSTHKPMKYILQWTTPKAVPFVYMGQGQEGFIERNCKYVNCYVTSDRNYLKDYTDFDVVAFSGTELLINSKYMRHMSKIDLPERRSPHQKYVFASIESSENYPICSKKLNSFFNWTWTYKLDSDARWGYFDIKDLQGNVVGPRKDMTWLKHEKMLPVSSEMRTLLDRKTKIAAWFVSNCEQKLYRTKFVENLKKELVVYNLTVDVYGECGKFKCGRNNEKECDEMVQKDYLFYLAFENSFSEDYVTEKVLHAVEYTIVPTLPVFLTGANITRFMPPGSYLNAGKLGPRKLAAKMHELANDKDKYAEYFRWVNHYTYARLAASPDTDEYCGFCSLLNNETLVKKKSVYKDFKQWWSPNASC